MVSRVFMHKCCEVDSDSPSILIFSEPVTTNEINHCTRANTYLTHGLRQEVYRACNPIPQTPSGQLGGFFEKKKKKNIPSIAIALINTLSDVWPSLPVFDPTMITTEVSSE
jgi:hypothetical protein